MNDKPMKALLVFDDREDTWLFRMAMENAESIDCDLVDVEHLDKSLRSSKENDFDLILMDLHRSSEHFLKTLARVRETAPGVPIVLPPENQNGFHPSGARREAAGSSRGLNGGNGDAVARAMRYAVRRQQLQAELPRLALMDDLTGLYNRRGFLLLGSQHMKMACRMKKNLLLFFADLDNLKQINDRFGHQEGDRALMRAAEIFKKTFRTSDITARLGGDEFTAIVMEDFGRSAETISQRLQQNMSNFAAKERRYDLSLSFGVAQYVPETSRSLDKLMAEADQALYKQKRSKHARPGGNSPVAFPRMLQDQIRNRIRAGGPADAKPGSAASRAVVLADL